MATKSNFCKFFIQLTIFATSFDFIASQTHGSVPSSDANGALAPLSPAQIEVSPAPDLQPVPQAPDMQDMQAPSLGRLNQFQGFYTPRPLPAGAQFTFASVWASWSAWSFCTEGVQMRVRACNTVRGFSCLGSNREIRPCEEIRSPSRFREMQILPPVLTATGDGIYKVDDPWLEDRQEALRQLSSRRQQEEVRAVQMAEEQQMEKAQHHLDHPNLIFQPQEVPEAKPSDDKYWHLRGQHAHHGTIAWGGKNATKNQLRSSKQLSRSKPGKSNSKSESIEDLEVGELARRLELEEPSHLAKQLIELDQKEIITTTPIPPSITNVPSTIPPTVSSRTITAKSTTVPSKLHVNSVEDITERWWEGRNSKTARQHHIDHTVSTDFGDTEESEDTVAVQRPPMKHAMTKGRTVTRPPTHSSTSRSGLSPPVKPNEIGRHTGRTRNRAGRGRDRPGPGNRIPPPFSSTGGRPRVRGEPRYQQLARGLQNARPLTSMTARERSVVAVMEAQKRKKYRKDGEAEGPGSDTVRALEWMLANMTKSLEEQETVQSKLHSGEAPSEQIGKSKILSQNHRNPTIPTSATVIPKSRAFGPGKARSRVGPERDENSLEEEESESAEEAKQEALERHRKRIITELKSAQQRSKEANQMEEEIARLRADLHAMEAKMHRIGHSSGTPTTTTRYTTTTTSISIIAINDDTAEEQDESESVEEESREEAVRVPEKPKNDAKFATHQPFEIGPMRIGDTMVVSRGTNNNSSSIEKLDSSSNAEWSAWGEWGACICGKQLRSRTCQYENAFHSNGCTGRSYETRRCFSSASNCPTTRRPPLPPSRTTPTSASSSDEDNDPSVAELRSDLMAESRDHSVAKLRSDLMAESRDSSSSVTDSHSNNDGDLMSDSQRMSNPTLISTARNNDMNSQHSLQSEFAGASGNLATVAPQLASSDNGNQRSDISPQIDTARASGGNMNSRSDFVAIAPPSMSSDNVNLVAPALSSRSAQFRSSLRRTALSIVPQPGGMRLRRLLRKR